MDYTVDTANGACLITLNGAFTFNDNAAFRAIVKQCEQSPSASSIIIDLAKVEFIDSAALGMLLLLREEAGKRTCGIVLRHAHGQVHKMFELSKFGDFFTLEK